MKTPTCFTCLVLIMIAFTPWAYGQEKSDEEAIVQTALDYIEGWYTGDAERMEQSLHPDLAKRVVRTDPEKNYSRVDHMSAMTLVKVTRKGYGKNTPVEKQQIIF